MHKRKDLGKLLNRLGLTGTGVEVGVLRGEFAAEILSVWEGRLLYLVDPWIEQPRSVYEDLCNVAQDVQDRNLRGTIERLAPQARRFEIMRMTSADAVSRFTDASLDFVYIDANHRHDSVRDDLMRWFPKVREGGIFAGHDYLNGTHGQTRFGVQAAVDSFAQEHSLDLQITNEWPTWFARKRSRQPMPPQDICVLMAYDAMQRSLGEFSVPNKVAYCKKHGYGLVIETDGFDRSRPPAWSKILFVKRHLHDHEWVFWSDADSMILNDAVRLETFLDADFDLIVGREDVGVGHAVVNVGAFFIRRSEWSLAFFDRLYAQESFAQHPHADNGALIELLGTEDLSEHIKIVPQRRFNSYATNFAPGDFLLHLPGMTEEERVRRMRDLAVPRFRHALRRRDDLMVRGQ